MTITPETIQRMREAANCKPWRLTDEEMMSMARAVLESCAQSGDWVMVPRELTQAMIDAGYLAIEQGRGIKSVWYCALAAAPQPPADSAGAFVDSIDLANAAEWARQVSEQSSVPRGIRKAAEGVARNLQRIRSNSRKTPPADPPIIAELRALVDEMEKYAHKILMESAKDDDRTAYGKACSHNSIWGDAFQLRAIVARHGGGE
jgi:hypothetical protein